MKNVSIIIPVYNVEEYLSRCIDSVLDQNNIQLEILLINDGSTDRSGYICDEYSKNDNRIKVFHQTNSGVSFARNIGLENAVGDWICFVDADDCIEKNSLEKILSIAANNTLDYIIARSHTIINGEAEKENYPFNENWGERIFKGTDLKIREHYGRGSVCGIIFNRLFLKNYNVTFPLNIKNGEDSIFSSICTIYADRVSFAYTKLYKVYERAESASRCWTFDRILNMINNISYIDNYIESHPELTIQQTHILNFAKYSVVSNIYNNFNHYFSLKNYFILRKIIKKILNKNKIDTGKIKTCKNKVKILNYSLELFSIMVLIKNKLYENK